MNYYAEGCHFTIMFVVLFIVQKNVVGVSIPSACCLSLKKCVNYTCALLQQRLLCLLQCSETCDQGEMTRNVTCHDKLARGQGASKGKTVNEEYCKRQGLTKSRETRHCNKNPCPYRWKSAPWSEV